MVVVKVKKATVSSSSSDFAENVQVNHRHHPSTGRQISADDDVVVALDDDVASDAVVVVHYLCIPSSPHNDYYLLHHFHHHFYRHHNYYCYYCPFCFSPLHSTISLLFDDSSPQYSFHQCRLIHPQSATDSPMVN